MISTEKDYKVFESLIGGFGLGKLQDAITIRKTLKQHDYTMDFAEDYVQWKKDAIEKEQKKRSEEFEEKREALIKILPICPECDAKLHPPVSIKHEKGRGNEYGYKSVWQCSGEECIYEKYNYETAIDLVKNLGYKEIN